MLQSHLVNERKMHRGLIWAVVAALVLSPAFATSQTAAPAFDANAVAVLQDLATKAAAQNITVVPQPQGLVVNKRMIFYTGPGVNIVGKTADEILTWSQQDLGGGRKRD
jgi:hypothetical protein